MAIEAIALTPESSRRAAFAHERTILPFRRGRRKDSPSDSQTLYHRRTDER